MKRALFSLFLVSAISILARAQMPPSLDQGLKPYGSFQHGNIDSVNLANGNLVFHAPLVSYPQRGGKLSLSFELLYSAKGWYPYQAQSDKVWEYAGGALSVASSPAMGVHGQIIKVTGPNGSLNIYLTSVVTEDGSSHDLSGGGVKQVDGETMDASGIHYVSSSAKVIDREGIQYSGTGYTSGYPVTDSTITDPNGNEITFASSTGWEDTLGRVIPGYNYTGNYGSFDQAPGTPTSTSGCPSGTAVALLWNAPGFNGGTAPFTFCFADFPWQTNFQQPGVYESSGTYRLLNAVILPNSTMWQFNYDTYLDLTSVTLPVGGSITYSYANWMDANGNMSRVVTQRTANANDGTGAHTTTYSYGNTIGGQSPVTLVTDPMGNDTTASMGGTCPAEAYVCQTQYYTGSHSSGTLLKTVTTQYSYMADPYTVYTGLSAVYANVVPVSQTVAWPGGKTSQTTTTYDSGFTFYVYQPSTGTNKQYTAYYGTPVLKTASDYGNGAPGAVLRQISTTYQWQGNSSYLTGNLLTLVSKEQTLDGRSNLCAETDYGYDDSSRLFTSTISTQHVSPPGPVRGNLSSVTRQLRGTTGPCQGSGSWTPIPSYVNAYDTGTTYQSIEPLGNTTTYAYSTSFAGAYPTTVTNALSQSTSFNYDFNTGLKISTTDPNSQTTSYTYDLMERLTQINYPDGGQTSFAYTDTPDASSVQVTQKIISGSNLVATAKVDGLGRTTLEELNSDLPIDYVETTYDADGRMSTVTNPYRSTSDPTYGVTTYYKYDGLSRIMTLIPPDGSASANNVTTSYSDNCTTVTDQQGRSRTSCLDGLGRMNQVTENGLGYVTNYTHDALGNLTGVNQSGQTRTFLYDSLSRLTSASNPESGSVTYTYDSNGNMATRTDARGTITSYSTVSCPYDPLNRLKCKSYSDSTPSVSYTYDQSSCLGGQSPCYNVGRRTGMTDGAGSQAWSYDSMGRVWTDQRTTNNVAHTFDYTYNYDGSLGSVAYPSGRTVTYLYNAAARLLSAADASNTYAQGAVYYAPGELDTLTVGQSGSYNIGVSQTFNSRLQPVNFDITTPGGSVMNLTYNFSLGTSDNGNVMSVTNNRDNTRNQTFTYDSLNRLAESWTAATSGTNCWGKTFNIDTSGNLYSNTAVSGYGSCAQTLLNLTMNSSGNNQFSTTSGFSYDAAGNTLGDGLYSYTYDAEGHQKSAAGVNYIYDGDGQRVEKANGTIYWYGTGGEVLTESALDGSSPVDYIYFGGRRLARVTSSAVYYYFGDHLDSARVVVQAGANASCYEADFEPYGSEHVVTGACSQHYKFTGKERDTETQNDYFPARFLESNLGRWLSPDPGGVNAVRLDDPQTWNMYAYVRNNPATLNDPTGLEEGTRVAKDSLGSLADLSCKSQPGMCMRGTDSPGQDPPPAQQTPAAQMTTLQFLGQELLGVYDTTAAPIVSTVEHPVQTVENAASNLVEGVKDIAKDPKGTLSGAAGGAKDIAVEFGSQVASGNPRAIGQAAGLVIVAYIAVRGIQGKEINVNDNLRIAPTGNRTGGVGELPHYHQRIVGPDGKTVPGGGIGWHRPWEP